MSGRQSSSGASAGQPTQRPAPPSSSGPAPAPAKHSFFGSLDGKLSAAGYAPPAAPAPEPPRPALSFGMWVELSVRLDGASPEDLAQALSTWDLTHEAWARLEREYFRMLSDDVRAGRYERPALYEAKYREEHARRAGHEGGRPAVLPGPAPEAGTPADLAGTVRGPGFAAEVWAAMGRMPFAPPAPEAPAAGKRTAKTMQSKAAPSHPGAETLPLRDAEPRPTPTLPFAGCNGGVGVGYVPSLHARQYLALRWELALELAPREATLRRYGVPTEAAFLTLDQDWRHPARRADLEAALADLTVVLRGLVLG
jgi:hypothetical protein